MDLMNVLTSQNTTVLLLLGGAALLVFNVVYGLIQALRGYPKAGFLSLVVAALACVFISVGTVQTANVISTPATNFAGRNGATGGFGGNSGGSNANAANGRTANSGTNNNNGSANNNAVVGTTNTGSGGNPASGSENNGNGSGNRSGRGRNATATAQAAQAAGSSNTASADNATVNVSDPNNANLTNGAGQKGAADPNSSGNTNSAGNGARNFGGNANGNPNAAAFAAQRTTAQTDQAGIQYALYACISATVFAFVVYFIEKRRPTFTASTSRSLLNLGAGVFTVVALLLIPVLPSQFAGPRPTPAFAARNGNGGAGGGFGGRVAQAVTPTPSSTPSPTDTPTDVPTLTPAPSETPFQLPTPIAYVSTYTTEMARSVCNATASTVVSLRPDPSTKQQAIGRLTGGQLLNILGMSADKQWYKVNVTYGSTNVQGWVSASYITLNLTCSGQTIPQVTQ